MKKHGISTTMKPCNKLRDILVHPKDKIKEMDKAQGVYKVEFSSHICLRCTEYCNGPHRKRKHKFDKEFTSARFLFLSLASSTRDSSLGISYVDLGTCNGGQIEK